MHPFPSTGYNRVYANPSHGRRPWPRHWQWTPAADADRTVEAVGALVGLRAMSQLMLGFTDWWRVHVAPLPFDTTSLWGATAAWVRLVDTHWFPLQTWRSAFDDCPHDPLEALHAPAPPDALTVLAEDEAWLQSPDVVWYGIGIEMLADEDINEYWDTLALWCWHQTQYTHWGLRGINLREIAKQRGTNWLPADEQAAWQASNALAFATTQLPPHTNLEQVCTWLDQHEGPPLGTVLRYCHAQIPDNDWANLSCAEFDEVYRGRWMLGWNEVPMLRSMIAEAQIVREVYDLMSSELAHDPPAVLAQLTTQLHSAAQQVAHQAAAHHG